MLFPAPSPAKLTNLYRARSMPTRELSVNPSPSDAELVHLSVKRFREGLVFKARRLLYHSTLGLRVIKRESRGGGDAGEARAGQGSGAA